MTRNAFLFILSLCLSTVFFSCAEKEEGKIKDAAVDGKVKFMILNPGHYHAALVQKSMYDRVAPIAHV